MTTRPWRPTNLHVAHSWGGGLDRWVSDFVAADPHSRNLRFTSWGHRDAYGLEHRLHGAAGELERHVLGRPVTEVARANVEYAELLAGILERHEVEHLYVSSFIGHSLDLLGTGLPTTVVHHDYFPFCPAISLTFGRQCGSCRSRRLARCLEKNPMARLFGRHDHRFWQRLRDDYFAALDASRPQHVCPSPSVWRNLTRVDRRFEGRPVRVIEHGVGYRRRYCFGGAPDDRRLRVIVLGHLSPFKGLDRLRRLLPRLRLLAEVHLVGTGPAGRELAGLPGVRWIESYRREELPEILEAIRPDLGLMPGEVAETFSYTLSELWAHTVPVCAPRLGSFVDRVVEGRGGFLVDLDLDRWVAKLVELDGDRSAVRGAADWLWQVPVRTRSDMVDDYYALRSDWLEWCDRRLASL